MKYYSGLTDLLNNDINAYDYYYTLPPATQTLLQGKHIRCMDELRQATLDAAMENRPRAF